LPSAAGTYVTVDFIPGLKGIRSGLADPQPRETGDAAAGDRPLGCRAIGVLTSSFIDEWGFTSLNALNDPVTFASFFNE